VAAVTSNICAETVADRHQRVPPVDTDLAATTTLPNVRIDVHPTTILAAIVGIGADS